MRHVVLAIALLWTSHTAAADAPSVIFILLDTTRADRLSALGNPRRTTPTLDALAARGVLFRRHFANSHATRPSLPQLMTGRYYHQNILRAFMPDAHPREFPFARPDPTAVLVPDLLRRHGYQTLGASAHVWVVADSALGRHFDRLEQVPVDASQGHADADRVVERGLALWRQRDPARPLFLYLHFMDMHVPRTLPAPPFRFEVPGYDWTRRFRPSGEPLFGRERRRWDRADARDFTAADRAHFAAVYDGCLAHTDAALGRLLAAVGADDPGLAHTIVVVAADHGEELGEDGRTYHTDSLADGVQHIPWIVTGGGVSPGQQAARFTENVDVAPTLFALLGIPLPPHARMDGRAQLTADGRLCERCGKTAVYYAWESYRAVRTPRHLLRTELPGSLRARCQGAETLYALEGDRRTIMPVESAIGRHLRRRIARRLMRRERAYLATRYGPPEASFVLAPEFWRLDDSARVACAPVELDMDHQRLTAPGWLWSGAGVTILRDGDEPALPVRLAVPEGEYQVEAGVVPIPRMPWFFGFTRWLRKSFLAPQPRTFVPLGNVHADREGLAVRVPPDVARHRHVVALRMTPPGVTPGARPTPIDEKQRRQLKALGYVE